MNLTNDYPLVGAIKIKDGLFIGDEMAAKVTLYNTIYNNILTILRLT